MNDYLCQSVEGHVRMAMALAGPHPSAPVDSWSEPAVRGQWVTIEDDEGRRSQVLMDRVIARGVAIRPGDVARCCRSLVDAVLREVREYMADGAPVVSRPLPDPPGDVHSAHVEWHGVWMRLVVGPEATGDVAVLSCLLGKGSMPLADPVEAVTWL